MVSLKTIKAIMNSKNKLKFSYSQENCIISDFQHFWNIVVFFLWKRINTSKEKFFRLSLLVIKLLAESFRLTCKNYLLLPFQIHEKHLVQRLEITVDVVDTKIDV